MKYFWMAIFACTLAAPLYAATETVVAAVPTIFYLHGRIIEEKGTRPVHRSWGLYDNPDVNFVFLASCGTWLSSKLDLHPTGHVFSIHEESDRIGGSCEEFVGRNDDLSSFSELEISTGKEHGAFYLPRAEWMAPIMHWIDG